MATARYSDKQRRVSVDIRQFTSSGTSSVFPGSKIKSMRCVDTRTDADCLKIGTACSQYVEFEFDDLEEQQRAKVAKGCVIKVEMHCDAPNSTQRTTNLGIFQVSEESWSERTDGNYRGSITAYDQMTALDKPFPSDRFSGAFSWTINTMIRYICQECGLYTGSGWSNSISVTSVPSNVTYRDMVRYMAGLQGSYAYIHPSSYRDSKSELWAGWYDEGDEFSLSEIYLDGYEKSLAPVTISSILSGTESAPAYYPYDSTRPDVIPAPEVSFCFENPYVTQSNVADIAREVGIAYATYSFYQGEIKWRGDPDYKAGNSFEVINRDGLTTSRFYIMEKEIVYDGGMYEIIRSYGANTDTVAFTEDPQQQEINSLKRRVNELERVGSLGYQYNNTECDFITVTTTLGDEMLLVYRIRKMLNVSNKGIAIITIDLGNTFYLGDSIITSFGATTTPNVTPRELIRHMQIIGFFSNRPNVWVSDYASAQPYEQGLVITQGEEPSSSGYSDVKVSIIISLGDV